MKTLTFLSTPSHGFLRVPVSMMTDEVFYCLSSYSFVGDRYFYLEEDCDCATFLGANPDVKVSVVQSNIAPHRLYKRLNAGDASSPQAIAFRNSLYLRREMEGLTA